MDKQALLGGFVKQFVIVFTAHSHPCLVQQAVVLITVNIKCGLGVSYGISNHHTSTHSYAALACVAYDSTPLPAERTKVQQHVVLFLLFVDGFAI